MPGNRKRPRRRDLRKGGTDDDNKRKKKSETEAPDCVVEKSETDTTTKLSSPLCSTVSFKSILKSLDSKDAATAFFDLAQNDVVSGFTSDVKVRQDRKTQKHTGGIIWETSYILASYLMERLDEESSFRPSILELGAGCGLLGITLAATKKAKSVCVTDQPIALKNLKKNVKLNPHEGLTAKALSWGDEDIGAETYDWICGTDVVFSKALVKPLLETIWRLFHKKSVCYLLIQEREPEAVRTLEKKAQKYFHEAEQIPIEMADTRLKRAAEELECRLYRYRKPKEREEG